MVVSDLDTRRGSAMTPAEIAEQIKKVINEDPTIEGARHIYVFTKKTGTWPFRKEAIYLSGDVYNEADKKKATEHALHAAGDWPVHNDIIITPS